ncbi:MAG: DUF1292 domain-containing protein [Bacilli bacterium]|nr:DUF1292 domain-containing protein [Bacilli bacterium]
MKGEKFEIELIDGSKKEATLVTRIKSEEKGFEYIYYAIDDDNEENGNASIYASKIIKENDKEVIKNLDNEDERQYAYKLFSETYKKLREQKNNE